MAGVVETACGRCLPREYEHVEPMRSMRLGPRGTSHYRVIGTEHHCVVEKIPEGGGGNQFIWRLMVDGRFTYAFFTKRLALQWCRYGEL